MFRQIVDILPNAIWFNYWFYKKIFEFNAHLNLLLEVRCQLFSDRIKLQLRNSLKPLEEENSIKPGELAVQYVS